MKVTLRRAEGINFIATTESGHEISMDGSAAVGGADLGARPMETVLAGLGGCSAIDVISILTKSRQEVGRCEIDIEAERADGIPAVFTRIHVHYRVHGPDLDDRKVARAISLSMEKYCSVTRMLAKTAEISSSYEIIQQ